MNYILLVEDNQQNADMAIHILTTAGYEVQHAATGFDGARMARANCPALILMDFNLPDLDGRTLTLSLKRQLGKLAPPIVAVTARAGSQEAYIAKSFGCSAFISKPYLPEELLQVVEQLIAKDSTAAKDTATKESAAK
jgi:CheY-like chemotaxis protein